MRTARDIKVAKLFQEYIKAMTPIIDKCDDDDMYFALIAEIVKREVAELHSVAWDRNHEKK